MEEISIEELTSKKIFNLLIDIEKNRNAYISEVYNQEYLHQIRVSIRKIRALCSLLKKYFKDNKAQDCKSSFSLIAKYTNEARDIDVYLIKLQEYKNILPKKRAKDIDVIIHYLKDQKDTEYNKLSTFFKSERYVYTILKYKSAFKSNSILRSAKTNAQETAKENLIKIHNKIVTNGLKLDINSSNSEFHRLRIEFKKLRYLIELFESFYSQFQYQSIVDKLKKIQDILGSFNDYDIQKKKLKSFIETLHLNKDQRDTLGLLIEHFEDEQEKLKRKFHKKFKNFCDNYFKEQMVNFG